MYQLVQTARMKGVLDGTPADRRAGRHDREPRAACTRCFRDGASWPKWSPLGSFELEQPGAQEPRGLGALRVFRTGRVRSRERIVELNPRPAPELRARVGLPLRGYRANIDLEPSGTEP